MFLVSVSLERSHQLERDSFHSPRLFAWFKHDWRMRQTVPPLSYSLPVLLESTHAGLSVLPHMQVDPSQETKGYSCPFSPANVSLVWKLLSSWLVLSELRPVEHMARSHQDKLGRPWINSSVRKEAENRDGHLRMKRFDSLQMIGLDKTRMFGAHSCAFITKKKQEWSIEISFFFRTLLINETCT